MADQPEKTKDVRAEARRQRLAEQLRSNLRKRKRQSRARMATTDTEPHQGRDKSNEPGR
jgi:hypothetical protein